MLGDSNLSMDRPFKNRINKIRGRSFLRTHPICSSFLVGRNSFISSLHRFQSWKCWAPNVSPPGFNHQEIADFLQFSLVFFGFLRFSSIFSPMEFLRPFPTSEALLYPPHGRTRRRPADSAVDPQGPFR